MFVIVVHCHTRLSPLPDYNLLEERTHRVCPCPEHTGHLIHAQGTKDKCLPCPPLGFQEPDKCCGGRPTHSLLLCWCPHDFMKKVGALASLLPAPQPSLSSLGLVLPSPLGQGSAREDHLYPDPHPSPLPVLVGAEDGNQINALLFNGSLGERRGTETEEQCAGRDRGAGAGQRGESREDEGQGGDELENERVGRRRLGRWGAAEAEPGHRGGHGEVGGGRREGQRNTQIHVHTEK